MIKSLNDFLAGNAKASTTGITFVEGGASDEFLSYARLFDEARQVLYNLQLQGVKQGDELVLLMEDNRSFLVGFWACLLGKMIAVPLHTGNQDEHISRFMKVWGGLPAPKLLTDEAHLSRILEFAGKSGVNEAVKADLQRRTMLVRDVSNGHAMAPVAPGSPDDLAFIQFSSGSTSEPKGVQLTHRNLVFNCQDIIARYQINSSDSSLSWMPLTHDMGLICFHLTSLLAGINQYIIPTSLFIRRPLLWMEKSSQYRITQIYSPNFGYYYLLSALDKEKNYNWDLSPIRLIYNGAEPISHQLCDSFLQTMRPFGLKENTMYPGYGLAEASVAVTLPTVHAPFRSYHLDRRRLNTGDVIRFCENAGDDTVNFVDVGYPIDHCRLRICDDHDHALPECTIGHIQIKGENVTKGYYNNEQVTRQVFTRDQWLKTGDLGFLIEGRLVITGRAKNLVIINGQNYYPQDIERICEGVEHAGPGRIVACSGRKPGTHREQLVLFVLFRQPLPGFIPLVVRMRAKLAEKMGLVPDAIVPVRRIPKTTSGKIQNFKLVAQYESGEFDQELNRIDQLLRETARDLSPGEQILVICRELTGNGAIAPDDNFLSAGAHSLIIAQMISRLQTRFNVSLCAEDLFIHNSADKLAAYVAQREKSPAEKITPTENNGYYDLTPAQRRLWMLSQLPGGSAAFNLFHGSVINAAVDIVCFEKALVTLVERHEILRTTFTAQEGVPKQKTRNAGEPGFKFDYADLRNSEVTMEMVRAWAADEAAKPFTLEEGPLLRVRLLQVTDCRFVFFFTIHHLIADGWSLAVIAREFSQLYAAYRGGKTCHLPAPSIQYKDFVAWRLHKLEESRLEAHRQFWLSQFSDEVPAVELPVRGNRPAVQTFNGGNVSTVLPAPVNAALKKLGNQEEATHFMVLLTCINLLLHKYSGQGDIVLGTDTAGRTLLELEDQVGYYLNFVPVRTTVTPRGTFTGLLAKVKHQVLQNFKHQEYPVEYLVEDLRAREKNTWRQPFFDVMVLLQNHGANAHFEDLVEGTAGETIEIPSRHSVADLLFEFTERGEVLHLNVQFNPDLYGSAFIEQLVAHFRVLVNAVVAHPERPIAAHTLMDAREMRQFADGLNDTRVSYPDESVITLFEKQAARTPGQVAVICAERAVTYQELNARANVLARCLRDEYHIGREDRVGVMMQRTEHVIVSILAVLKASAAYVPVDPGYPGERVRYLVKDSALRLLLSDRTVEESPGTDVVLVQSLASRTGIDAGNLDFRPAPHDLAYIIYTSGTTGQPKGVMIEHRALADYVLTFARYFKIDEQACIIHQASLSFDTAVEEIYPVLICGGKLVVSRNGGSDAEALASEIEQNKVTLLSATPVVLNQISNYVPKLSSLAAIISGGDVLHVADVERLLPVARVYNTYGPTESTVCATYQAVDSPADVASIGKPIANRRVYLLDETLAPVPAGVVGEICIGGAGVARGYLNLHELTGKVFVEDPFVPGARLYKTGDLGRYRPDGTIEFLGRKDEQVKIRGYRVELREIENLLLQHESVRQAAVVARQIAGEPCLVAYICPVAPETQCDFYQYLSRHLPAYLVPAHFVVLEALPWLPNGKLNKRALPEPAQHANTLYVAPATAMEAALAAVFEAVLGTGPIGVLDNFFSRGGHSLKAVKAISRIRALHNDRLELRDLFEHPTVRALASRVSAGRSEAGHGIPVTGEMSYYPVTYAQQQLWVLHEMDPARAAFNLSWAFAMDGPLDAGAFEKVFQALVRRHENLRATFLMIDGELRQRISAADDTGFAVQYLDCTGETVDGQTVQKLIDRNVREPFDLERGPLLRVKLVRLSARQHVFLCALHHIISDGWSMEVLSGEIKALYLQFRSAGAAPLPPPRIQYKDYVAWKQRLKVESQRAYWLNELAGPLPVIQLPVFGPRPKVRSFKGKSLAFQLGEGTLAALQRLSRGNDATLFMAIVTVLKVLLCRYTGQKDIIIGTDTAGRNHRDLEPLVGYFLNPIAIRTQLEETENFCDCLARVKSKVLGAFENQEYPFDKLVTDLALPRDSSLPPVFSILVLLHNFDQALRFEALSDDLRIVALEQEITSSITDLQFEFVERGSGLSLKARFNDDVYDEAVISRFVGHFEKLVRLVDHHPGKPVTRHALVEYPPVAHLPGNDPLPRKPDQADPLTGLLGGLGAGRGSRVAVACNDRVLTYAELHERSNQLAHYLRDYCRVPVEARIGVLLQRSEYLVVAMLGILKAGACYVPIDPEYPGKRVKFLIEESKVSLVLSDRESMRRHDDLRDERFIIREDTQAALAGCSKRNVPLRHAPDNLAYIIYTSGSTGTPKGVMIEHHSLTDYVATCIAYFKLTADDVVVQQASLSFDTAVEEIFPILCVAGKLVVAEEGGRNIPALVRTIVANNVTVLSTTPLVLNEVNRLGDQLPALRLVISGGDELKPHYVDQLIKRATVFNTYGPTESTVCATYHQVTEPAGAAVIGVPIPGRKVYLMDENRQLVPDGVVGELYLGGAGLARGYTDPVFDSVFIGNPHCPAERLYQTGDLARVLPDGSIQFVGRKDLQIKLRGYRIEPGEIESALRAHASVEEALVVVGETPAEEKYLAAYYTGVSVPAGDLRKYLKQRLPYYMVPQYLVWLDRLPVTYSGKVDRARLPVPRESGESAVEYAAPTTSLEEKLLQLWKEVLNRDQLGVLDDFFEAGGHSLKAAQVISRLQLEYNVGIGLRDLFANPTVSALAAALAAGRQRSGRSIRPVEEQQFFNVSHGQKRLYILSQFDDGRAAYNISLAYRLLGRVEVSRLEQVFVALIERHEALRTVFVSVGGEIRQRVLEKEQVRWAIDFENPESREGTDAEVREIANRVARRVFDLEAGPLLHVKLVRRSEDEHLLIITVHHIVSDAWSIEVLAREAMRLYTRQVERLPPLPIQYKDYSAWQNGNTAAGKFGEDRAYWLEQFRDEVPGLNLPAVYARSHGKKYAGNTVRSVLGRQVSDGLLSLCRREKATPFMGMLAAVYAILYRYTQQDDLVIGTPVAGREGADLDDQIGFYVNTLPLRARVKEKDSFASLLRRVKKVVSDALHHQAYPFDLLVNDLNLKYDAGRNAMFDVMVVFLNDHHPPVAAHRGSMKTEAFRIDSAFSKFDLCLNVIETGGEMELALEYNTGLFDQRWIARFTDHFTRLLASVAANVDGRLAAIDFLSPDEKKSLLSKSSGGRLQAGTPGLLHQLVEERALASPSQCALVCEEATLSYQSLNRRANQLAHYLRTRHAIGRNDLVGLLLDRTAGSVVSILGILKAGAAYVPIDPAYPDERINYIIEDVGLKAIITTTDVLRAGATAPVPSAIRFDAIEKDLDQYPHENPATVNDSSDLAYIIYTSGSTGQPKGVAIEHRNAVSFIDWAGTEFSNSVFDYTIACTSYCFDLSIFELFYTLHAGKTVLLVPSGLDIPKHLSRKNLLINTVPSVVEALIGNGCDLGNVTVLNMAGEPVPLSVKRALDCTRMEIRNLYGPSEDTTYSSCYRFRQQDPVVPIGRPIANTQFYVLDAHLQLVPEGVPGEICIAGSGLARGYMNKVTLTDEKFVENPFAAGTKLYRTGDLGYWLPDGNLMFAGRKDNQVKIRGYRIELGEIEGALQLHPAVAQALVTGVQVQDEKHLIAYYTLRNEAGPQHIRAYLQGKVPPYMVPAYLMPLQAFPMTANGKIDRKALPKPNVASQTGYDPPATGTESVLVKITGQVLDRSLVGVRDNFFEIGGHSLRAMQLIAGIYNHFSVKVTLREIFNYPAIRDLAVLIETKARSQHEKILPVEEQAHYGASNGQRSVWLIHELDRANVAYNMSSAHLLSGPLQVDALEKAFRALIRRHESLRTSFVAENGYPRQRVTPADQVHFTLRYTAIPEDVAHKEVVLHQVCRQEADTVFDLENGPLMRANLIRVRDREHCLVITLHHSIFDGWSSAVFVQDLTALYHLAQQGSTGSLPALSIQYKDFTAWQSRQLSGRQLMHHQQYWLSRFGGGVPVLNFPLDFPRPAIRTFNGSVTETVLDQQLAGKLAGLGAERNVTTYMTMLASVNVLLHFYTGQTDIVVGTPVSNRAHSELSNQIGFYTNTLALRTTLSENDSFAALLDQVRTHTLDAFEHQMYPMDCLLEDLGVQGPARRSSLFDVMLAFESSTERHGPVSGDLMIREHRVLQPTAKFDLMFGVVESAGQLTVKVTYASDLFSALKMELLNDRFVALLGAVADNPFITIKQLAHFLQDDALAVENLDVGLSLEIDL